LARSWSRLSHAARSPPLETIWVLRRPRHKRAWTISPQSTAGRDRRTHPGLSPMQHRDLATSQLGCGFNRSMHISLDTRHCFTPAEHRHASSASRGHARARTDFARTRRFSGSADLIGRAKARSGETHHGDRDIRVGNGRRAARAVDHVQYAALPYAGIQEDREQVVEA